MSTPARCKKCGHEGALPPDDPLTGEKRFDCPICGEPALAPLDEPPPAVAPIERLPFQVVDGGLAPVSELPAPPRAPIKTIYEPATPRPRDWLGGSLHDLRALVPTTILVLRAGLLPAFLSSLVLAPLAAVVLAVSLMFWVVCCLSGPGIVVAIALVYAGPLAAFGLAAMGEKPTVGRVLELAVRRAPLLALTVLAPSAAAILLVFFVAVGGNSGAGEIATLIVAIGCALAFVFSYVRFFLLAHVVAVLANAGDKSRALRGVPALCKGRTVMLGFVAGATMAIQGAAYPPPFAHDIAVSWLGSNGAALLHVAVALAAGIVSVLLGSAMLASAFAVILATPIEEMSGPRSL